jgi:hypothetical protein
MRRVLASLAVLPLLLLVVLVAAVRLSEFAPPPFAYNELSGVGPMFIFITYVLMGCVAVPLLLLTFWRRWLLLWHMVTIGALTGLFAVALPIWPLLSDEKLHLHYRLARLGDGYPFVLFGAVGGAVFWLLAIHGNRSLRAAQQNHARSSERAA